MHATTTYKIISTQDICEQAIAPVLVDHGFNADSLRIDVKRFGRSKDYVTVDLKDRTMDINGDKITPQLRVYNSYDGSAAFRIMLGAFRWVCWNGLSSGDFAYSERIVHRVGPTADKKLAAISEQVSSALDFLTSEYSEVLNNVASLKVSDEQAIDIIGSLRVSDSVKHRSISRHFNPRRLSDQGQKNNLWGLWNNVNESLREKSRGFKAVADNDGLLDDIMALYDNSLTLITPAA